MTAVPGTGAKFYVDGKEFVSSEPIQFDGNDVALDMAEEAGFDVSLLRLLLRLHREGTSVVRYAKSPIEFTGCCAEVSGYIDGQNTWTIQATFRDCEHIDA